MKKDLENVKNAKNKITSIVPVPTPMPTPVPVDTITVVRKKGRPRKYAIPEEVKIDTENPPEKKRRGRKKKEVPTTPKIKQKRGRKALIKFFSSSIRKRIPLTNIIHDNDKNILHLDIKNEEVETNNFNLSGLDNFSESQPSIPFNYPSLIENWAQGAQGDSNLLELYENRLKTRIKHDSILMEKLENAKVEDIDKTLKTLGISESVPTPTTPVEEKVPVHDKVHDGSNRARGYFNVLAKLFEKNWLHTTDVCCWWCCHTFNTVPIGIPVDYSASYESVNRYGTCKQAKSKFRVKGVFCSFGCMIAYGNEDNNINKARFMSLTTFLYKKLTGGTCTASKEDYRKSLDSRYPITLFGGDLNLKEQYIQSLLDLVETQLKPAPPRCTLKMFGGQLSIDEFRNAIHERKIYKMVEYPLSVSRDYIEEIDIKHIKQINTKVFKHNAEKSMGITEDESKLHEIKMDNAKKRIEKTTDKVSTTGINKFIRF
jgi:hypothetical protein